MLITLCKCIFLFISTDNYLIESIFIHFFQFQYIHQPKIFKYLVKCLSLGKTSYIVNTRIKNYLIADKSLEASADLFIFFEYAYTISFTTKYVCTNQSAHSTADDHDIKIFLHDAVCSCFTTKIILDVYFVLSISVHIIFFSSAIFRIALPEINDRPSELVLLKPKNLVEKNSVSLVPLCLSFKSLLPSLIIIFPPGFRLSIHFSMIVFC